MKLNRGLVFLLALSIAAFFALNAFAAPPPANEEPDANFDDGICSLLENLGYNEVEVWESAGLTGDVLEARNGKTIVERCYGVVENAKTGDGKLLNPYDPDYDYISYKGVSFEIENGLEVFTYLVYNPDNNYVDDILFRIDIPVLK